MQGKSAFCIGAAILLLGVSVIPSLTATKAMVQSFDTNVCNLTTRRACKMIGIISDLNNSKNNNTDNPLTTSFNCKLVFYLVYWNGTIYNKGILRGNAKCTIDYFIRVGWVSKHFIRATFDFWISNLSSST
jgi:hypothetical protein